MKFHAALLLAGSLAGCGDDIGTQTNQGDDTGEVVDTTPPTITHTAVTDAQIIGQSVAISAIITDDNVGEPNGLQDPGESQIFVAQVFFKQETSTVWDSAVLMLAGEGGQYQGQIPGSAIGSAGMHYYLYAMDTEENEAYAPEEGEDDPYHFRITADD